VVRAELLSLPKKRSALAGEKCDQIRLQLEPARSVRLVEQGVVPPQHAEVDQEARVIVILDVLECPFAQRVLVVSGLLGETIETKPHPQIVETAAILMGDGTGGVERPVLPCRVAVRLPDDSL